MNSKGNKANGGLHLKKDKANKTQIKRLVQVKKVHLCEKKLRKIRRAPEVPQG